MTGQGRLRFYWSQCDLGSCQLRAETVASIRHLGAVRHRGVSRSAVRRCRLTALSPLLRFSLTSRRSLGGHGTQSRLRLCRPSRKICALAPGPWEASAPRHCLYWPSHTERHAVHVTVSKFILH